MSVCPSFVSVAVVAGSMFVFGCGHGSSSSSMAPSSVAPSSATVSSVAVNGSTDFTSIGQTVQLTATATFSDGATQNVSATATWQALSVGATVTSGGLVTAVTSGTVTISGNIPREIWPGRRPNFSYHAFTWLHERDH